MNTQHFRYALEIERTRSITRAADNLYMAQPNLSKAIRELENHLGITIFDRTPKGVLPTKKGAAFLAHARNVVAQVEMMRGLREDDLPLRQSLRVSIPRGSYIAEAFTRFAARLDVDQEIELGIQETNTAQTIANVAEGRSHLGVIRYRTDYEDYFMDLLKERNLAIQPVWQFEYQILFSSEHPLADKAAVCAAELIPYIEIVYGDRTVPHALTTDSGAPGRKRISVYGRCAEFELLSGVHTAYIWDSPVPQRLLEQYGLTRRRCADRHRMRKDALIFPDQTVFTELDHLFLEKLYQTRDEMQIK